MMWSKPGFRSLENCLRICSNEYFFSATAVLEDKEWKPLREGYDYLDLVKKAEERKKYGDTTIEPSEQADEENTKEAVASEQMKEKPRRDEL